MKRTQQSYHPKGDWSQVALGIRKLGASLRWHGTIATVILVLSCFNSTAFAQPIDTRSYTISILVFKHFPADKNTAPRLTERWTPQMFANTTAYDLLPARQSLLADSYYALYKNKNYEILYNGAWNAELSYSAPSRFYAHKNLNNGEALDLLIDITLKYTLDVHFQSQLLTPIANGLVDIDTVNESFQTPSNQIQYIDGPIYGALIKITRATL